jgi:hypothetical protein
MVGVACLPILILLSYSHSDPAMANLRASAAWLFVLLLYLLTKTLLQDYLQQALLHVVSTLARPLGSNPGEHANDDSTVITHTFTSRYENVVRLGSQLVSFPLLLVMLLTTGHLCNLLHTPIYPCTYGIPVANVEKTQMWEQQKAQAMAQSVLNNDVNSTRKLRDGNAESCQAIPALSATSSTKKIEEAAITNPAEATMAFGGITLCDDGRYQRMVLGLNTLDFGDQLSISAPSFCHCIVQQLMTVNIDGCIDGQGVGERSPLNAPLAAQIKHQGMARRYPHGTQFSTPHHLVLVMHRVRIGAPADAIAQFVDNKFQAETHQ